MIIILIQLFNYQVLLFNIKKDLLYIIQLYLNIEIQIDYNN